MADDGERAAVDEHRPVGVSDARKPFGLEENGLDEDTAVYVLGLFLESVEVA